MAFYKNKSGFNCPHQEAGFAILQRDEVELHLWAAADESWKNKGAALAAGLKVFGRYCQLPHTGAGHLCIIREVQNAEGYLQPRCGCGNETLGIQEVPGVGSSPQFAYFL